MTLKGMLKTTTSLMVVCGGLMSSYAYAEDYVTTSRINAANGVAGLNESKQVTADVNNNNVTTQILTASGITNLNNSVYIAKDKVLSFKSEKKDKDGKFIEEIHGVYLTLANDKNLNGERGDLYIGTQVGDGANIRGVNGYYGNSLTVSQQVSSPKFIGTLSTPSSSSAACTAGEFKDDANYHYVCVAANKWKRVALSDF